LGKSANVPEDNNSAEVLIDLFTTIGCTVSHPKIISEMPNTDNICFILNYGLKGYNNP
jgi:hypothetical protein